MYTWEKNCRQCVGRYPTIYSFKRNKEARRTRRGEVIIFGDGAAHISFQVGTKGGEGWPLICNRRLTYDDMISCFPTLTPWHQHMQWDIGDVGYLSAAIFNYTAILFFSISYRYEVYLYQGLFFTSGSRHC